MNKEEPHKSKAQVRRQQMLERIEKWKENRSDAKEAFDELLKRAARPKK